MMRVVAAIVYWGCWIGVVTNVAMASFFAIYPNDNERLRPAPILVSALILAAVGYMARVYLKRR